MEEQCSHHWCGKPVVAVMDLVTLAKLRVVHAQIEVCGLRWKESVVNSGQMVNLTELRSHPETAL
jgi:hypothetical protein